jgi:hypothetical protein
MVNNCFSSEQLGNAKVGSTHLKNNGYCAFLKFAMLLAALVSPDVALAARPFA